MSLLAWVLTGDAANVDAVSKLARPAKVYLPTAVEVTLEDGTTADADMYVWNGDAENLTSEEWKLEDFVKQRLEDWIDLFAGMEMCGDSLNEQ
ncbi:hypothetical protein ACHAPU_003345 [Fusarium lateritium]